MTRYLLFSVLFLFVQLYCSAQSITVVSDERLVIPAEGAVYSPAISPLGDYILVTSETSAGLQKYDLTTGELSVICSDEGAGYSPQISADGKMIVYRELTYKDHLRYKSIKAVNVDTGEATTVVEPSRGVTAFVAREGTAVALRDGNVIQKDIVGERLKTAPTIVSMNNDKMMVTHNGVTKQINPRGASSYLWASVSPDGTRLLFAVAESGMIAYTSDLDGGNLARLGRMSAPVWMGDDYVVGMVDEDDGEVITGSVIVGASADGAWYGSLTDGSEICLFPSGAADASKIVYNTDAGEVHLMTITTK